MSCLLLWRILLLPCLMVVVGLPSTSEPDEILRLLNASLAISEASEGATRENDLIEDIRTMTRMGYADQAFEHIKRVRHAAADSPFGPMASALAIECVKQGQTDRCIEIVTECNSWLGINERTRLWKNNVVIHGVAACLAEKKVDDAIRLAQLLSVDQAGQLEARMRVWGGISEAMVRQEKPDQALQLIKETFGSVPDPVAMRMLQAAMHSNQFEWYKDNFDELANDKERQIERAMSWASHNKDYPFVLQQIESRYQVDSKEAQNHLQVLATVCDSVEALNRIRDFVPNLANQPQLATRLASSYARVGQPETCREIINLVEQALRKYRNRSHFSAPTFLLAKRLSVMNEQDSEMQARALLDEIPVDWYRTMVKVHYAALAMESGNDDLASELAEELVTEFKKLDYVHSQIAFSAYPVLSEYGFEKQARTYVDLKSLSSATPVVRFLIRDGQIEACKDLLNQLEDVEVSSRLDPFLLQEIASGIDVESAIQLTRRIKEKNPATPGAVDSIGNRYAELFVNCVKSGQMEFAGQLHKLLAKEISMFRVESELHQFRLNEEQLLYLARMFEHDHFGTMMTLKRMVGRCETSTLLKTLEKALQHPQQKEQWKAGELLTVFRQLVKAGKLNELKAESANYQLPELKEYLAELESLNLVAEKNPDEAVRLARSIPSPSTRRLLYRRCAEAMYQKKNRETK